MAGLKPLKPCPFKRCKNKDTLVLMHQIGIDLYIYFAYCPECGARGPREYTELQAIDVWNKRS